MPGGPADDKCELAFLVESPVVVGQLDGSAGVKEGRRRLEEEPERADLTVNVHLRLVVPVIRNAERLSFAQIEVTIGDYGRRAKENKLKLEELQGGTFTISNGGVYGSLLSTPIINPPQSGVLGLHAIQERPVAREGAVVIRPMMYIALTYDHRLVDGREAVSFLRRVKEVMESPARMLMEI